MSLITRCPVCETMFKVVADQFKVAQGWVRCGYCGEVFDAALHLVPAEVAAQYLRSHQDAQVSPVQDVRPGDASASAAQPAVPPQPEPELQPEPQPKLSKLQQQDNVLVALPVAEPAQGEANAAVPDEAPACAPVPEFSGPPPDSAEGMHEVASPASPVDAWPQTADDGLVDQSALPPAQELPAQQDLPAHDIKQEPELGSEPEPEQKKAPEPQPASVAQALPEPLATPETPETPEISEIPQATELAPVPADPSETLPVSALLVQVSPEPREPVFGTPKSLRTSVSSLNHAESTGAASSFKSAPAQAKPDIKVSSQTQAETPEVSFVRDARRKAFWASPLVRGVLALLSLVLLVTLLLQWVLQQKDNLAAMDPRLAPALRTLCAPLNCTLRPPRHIESLVIDSSNFSQVGPEVYRLSFALKNNSAAVLEMPSLEVTLTDAQEQALMRRVLTPAQFGAGVGPLAGHGEISGTVTLKVSANPAPGALAPQPLPVNGYRILAFYP